MPNDDDKTNWDQVDSDWIAEHRPDRLNETHLERLCRKHGDRAGTEKYQSAINRYLRGVRLAPPYRSGR